MRHPRSLAALAALALLAACADGPTEPRAEVPQPASQVEGYPVHGELRTGWIHGPGGDPLEVTFQVIDGRAVFEGDIDLGPAEAVPATREALVGPPGRKDGAIINGTNRRWGGGSVAYEISTSFSSTQRQTILDAISYVQATTPGVTFYAKGSYTSDWVRFVPSTGCSSAVGRQGGRQDINLATGCTWGNTVHEILHALGMWHEQSRCNRDTYVEIRLYNVQSGQTHNFNKQCTGSTDVPNNRYDEGSIMHYGPYAFSSNGQPTIVSRRGLDYLMGQRSGMSGDDVYTIDWMYPPPITGFTVTYPGGTPNLNWNAVRNAVSYEVNFVERYYENDYERGVTEQEYRTRIATTTGTSAQDPWNTYTGVDRCDYSSWYTIIEYSYYYEVIATFPSGLKKYAWADAQVGQC